MEVGIGISGLGRIGRLLIRRAFSDKYNDMQIKALNSPHSVETIAHLLKYDTVHGTWNADISTEDGKLIINGKVLNYFMERDPSRLPWTEAGVDIVIDATGKFTDRMGAEKHLAAGAHSVIITSPGKDADLTVVMGVNEESYEPNEHHILSAASCTTNCVAPILKLLDDAFKVKSGWMTTIHSFTSDQNHLDNPHKDLRRARACTQSIIPTTTGVGKALIDVLPHLAPHIQGLSIRVPTTNVSLIDLTVRLGSYTTLVEAKRKIRSIISGGLAPYVDMHDVPLVSSDYIGNDCSAVVDGSSLMVAGDQLKILAWYDNEWAYSCRVIDLAAMVVQKTQFMGGMKQCNQAAAN
jgi:glyceraldehyde 3-phosphate dehydrogenase